MSAALIMCVLGLVTSDGQGEEARMESDGEPQVEQVFDVGERVERTFYVSSDGDAGVFGVDFSIDCEGIGLRIASVQFAPQFSIPVGPQRVELPAKRLHVQRMQSPRFMNRSLGANGNDVPFATVEFEVLTDGPFTAEAAVCSRVSLIGEVAKRTSVLGSRSANNRSRTGESRIEFKSSWNRNDWTYDVASLAIELRDPNSGLAVTSLQVGETYEVHYASSFNGSTDFNLYVVSDVPGARVTASAAPTGRWASAAHFSDATIDDAIQADGFAQGYEWRQAIGDFFWPKTNTQATARASQGMLCEITPTVEGDLHLQLHMMWMDPVQAEFVDMWAVGSYAVAEAP